MNLIAADIGNSTTKLVVGKSDDMRFISNQFVIHGDDDISIELPDEPCFWSLCSVSKPRCEKLIDWIETNRPDDQHHIISESDVELKTAVENREATGRDRLVAALMAASLADDQSPFIVIDAGTAITIDFVREDRTFMGGVIFPGASTQLRHLSAATDALPDLAGDQNQLQIEQILSDVIGNNTESAILKGVFHSQLSSIKTIVEKMNQAADQRCEVFATGGGIERLREFLPEHWNIVPNLVLQGAFAIGASIIGTAKPNVS